MIDEQIEGYSNLELLENVVIAAGGDDWDGCFTENGKKHFAALLNELRERLKNNNFIEEGDNFKNIEDFYRI